MARKYPSKRKLAVPAQKAAARSWAVAGVDVSLTSMSGAILVYDSLLDRMRGPGLFSVRWERPVHFLDRLAQATRAGDFMLDLMAKAGPVTVPSENTWIAVEEPWPAGLVRRAESGWLRQQAQVQGAFMGGLVRYGFQRVYEVNSQSWRKGVADDLGVKLNREFTKWTVKKWAMKAYAVPDFTDLIDHGTRGLIPRPENSKAKARQPDDVYDALGIMSWMDETRMGEI